MNREVYPTKTVIMAFPHLKSGSINHWIKIGALPIRHASNQTGIPHLFTEKEMVHAGVLDELSTLGIFDGKNQRRTIRYLDSWRDKDSKPHYSVRSNNFSDPKERYYVDYEFYEKHDYNVIIEVEVRHDFLPGANVPKETKGPGRYYIVTYAPEFIEEEHTNEGLIRYDQHSLGRWFDPHKTRHNKAITAKGFIRVRLLYEMVKEAIAQS